jgi:glycosyltransferase involved in cell wall biosynthesis
MGRVALLVPCFIEADAVSTDVLGMYRALSARGHEVHIFASHREVADPAARPVAAARSLLADPAVVAVYHLAAGWREGAEALARARCKRVLKYHNVTPAEFFAGIDQEYVLACREGRAELAALARAGLDRYLADSDYNLRELLDEGAPPETGAVVPPFHNIHRLLDTDADPDVLTRLRDGKANFLIVGRLAPNKGHAALLEAFALYRRRNPDSRLLIVGRGDARLSVYSEALRALTTRLELEDSVLFTGGVPLAALRAYYQAAHVFVITSRHEGFCVPVVEAMALGVPVLALGSTAVPGTVGDAGVVWQEDDAGLLAESMHRLVTDREAAEALGIRGRRRYADHFTNGRIEARFLATLGRLCGSNRI